MIPQTKWTTGSTITFTSLETFLYSLPIKISPTKTVHYEENIFPAPNGDSVFTKREIDLKPGSASLFPQLLVSLSLFETVETTFKNLVEDICVRSTLKMGALDRGIIVDNKLLLLCSRDFEIHVYFDEEWKSHMGLLCKTRCRNFLADIGGIDPMDPWDPWRLSIEKYL